MIEIEDLLGVRYKPNGRDKSGYDCYGLAIEVEKRFGHEVPDFAEIKEKDRNYKLCLDIGEEKTNNIKEVSLPKNEGDLILFKNEIGVNHHIGVFLGNGKFIHCDRHGVHIENINRYPVEIGRVYTWL